MKNLKEYLDDLISTASFSPPSNAVGTRTPDGGFANPKMGPQDEPKKGNIKLKKKSKINKTQIGKINKRPTMFKISPAEWELEKDDDKDTKTINDKK